MYRGKTKQVAKIWATIGGSQISEIPSGATITGGKPASGYAYINSGSYGGKAWKAGYTKEIWLSGYVEVVTPPPPPPPPLPDPNPTITLKHVIEVWSDGSIKIDGNTYP